MTSVTFTTNIYSKTIDKVLLDGFLYNQLDIMKYPFLQKLITINGYYTSEEKRIIKNKIQNNFPGFEYCFTYDMADKVLESFNLTKHDMVQSFQYAIHHFASLYYNVSDYLLYMDDDCPIQKWHPRFIERSIALMESCPEIICTQPAWDKDAQGARLENIEEIDNFFMEYGFTDQMHLLNTKVFREDIYHWNHPESNRYPVYCTNGFERRVDSYMHSTQHYRAVDKLSYYIHEG